MGGLKNCPKGYGEVEFVGTTTNYCPVSRAISCKECDMPFWADWRDEQKRKSRQQS